MKALMVTGLLAASIIAVAPSSHAASCVQDTGVGAVDDKIVGDTCTDCGWVKVRGQAYTLFYCD